MRQITISPELDTAPSWIYSFADLISSLPEAKPLLLKKSDRCNVSSDSCHMRTQPSARTPGRQNLPAPPWCRRQRRRRAWKGSRRIDTPEQVAWRQPLEHGKAAQRRQHDHRIQLVIRDWIWIWVGQLIILELAECLCVATIMKYLI